MLTPAFELAQDNDFLIITIYAPYTKIAETEIYFHETDFMFYSKPYFLRLNLPGQVIENGSEKATYDSDKGTFVVHVPKLTTGEHFEGLEFITKLLTPKKKIISCSPVEVLDTDGSNSNEVLNDVDDFTWEIDQIPNTLEEHLSFENEKYGFANQYSGVVSRLEEELNEIIDIRNPDKKSVLQRREERLKAEEEYFSENHYLCDLYDDKEIQRLMEYKPPWASVYKKLDEKPCISSDDLVSFTEKEKEKMRNLPNKDYLIDDCNVRYQLLFGLVDIIFAYAYDARTTEGENTVESVWTLRKLSSTLSWFETHPTLEAAVLSGIRRSLCYPLYRHWGLATTLLTDLQQILTLGTKYVVKCLLNIHSLMNTSDPHYILNDLYITDYCIWTQTVKSETFCYLSEAIKKLDISKERLNLDLVELETGAKLALREDEESSEESDTDDASTSGSSVDEDRLCAAVKRVAITNSDDDDDDSETSDDSTTIDSDDFSSSEEDRSSNSDNESTDSSAEEDGLLLRKGKCLERKR